MDIKKIAKNSLNFTLNRLIEIFGILVSIAGILIFLALFSYSAEDPNFVFPDNTEIKNLLGFQGSFNLGSTVSIFWFSSLSFANYFFFYRYKYFIKKRFFSHN